MALTGVIIHAVCSICSFSARENPVGLKELLEGHVLDLCVQTKPIICLHFNSNCTRVQSHYIELSDNKSECCFGRYDGVEFT